MRHFDMSGIFYCFPQDEYLVGTQVRGEIVKLWRVILMPDVHGE